MVMKNMITDEDFESRGYRKWKPSPIDPEGVQYLYQKRFDDEQDGIKYFITAKRWYLPLHNPQNDIFDGYEFEIQLYQSGTHNAIDLSFHKDWTIDDVEEYTDKIYRSCPFEPYERWVEGG